MFSSPWQRAWEGNEDVAAPFDAGAALECSHLSTDGDFSGRELHQRSGDAVGDRMWQAGGVGRAGPLQHTPGLSVPAPKASTPARLRGSLPSPMHPANTRDAHGILPLRFSAPPL